MSEVFEPVEWGALSHADRVDALVQMQRHKARIDAEEYRLLAVMAADPPVSVLGGGDEKDWLREDVACALRLSFGFAAQLIARAVTLTRAPETLALLEVGAITTHHARALSDAIHELDDASAAAVEARVLPRASEQSYGAFQQSLRRALLALAPAAEQSARASNVAERRVSCRPCGVGVSGLWAVLPDEGAASVMAALSALADRSEPGDERTREQRQADALVQLALDGLTGDSSAVLPRRQRLRPAIQVSVALSTLLGLDEQPAELADIGPIPAALARRLAADPSGTWRRLLTDERGQLLDYARTTYRPPADLATHVIARDRMCRFPHCRRAAQRCDLDHTVAWKDGGATSQENIHALCPRHHHLKHDAGWTYRREPDGTIHWRSPTGHRYTKPHDPYPIDTTMRRHPDNDLADDPDPPPS